QWLSRDHARQIDQHYSASGSNQPSGGLVLLQISDVRSKRCCRGLFNTRLIDPGSSPSDPISKPFDELSLFVGGRNVLTATGEHQQGFIWLHPTKKCARRPLNASGWLQRCLRNTQHQASTSCARRCIPSLSIIGFVMTVISKSCCGR